MGDEFKMWYSGPKWYCKLRTYAYLAVVLASFQAGQYYNASLIMDVMLPRDTSVVRDADKWEFKDEQLAIESMK